MLKIKKGDTVKIIAGKEKGEEGKVLRVIDGKRVIIEGKNQVVKHSKPSQDNPKGGIIHKEAPIDMSQFATKEDIAKLREELLKRPTPTQPTTINRSI